MYTFGWTIEYTLALPFPVFLNLFVLIRRVRFDAAIDEFYTPYGAAKYGGKCAKTLFEGRGPLMLTENAAKASSAAGRKPEKVTQSMIRAAMKKALAIAARNEAKLAEAAGKAN